MLALAWLLLTYLLNDESTASLPPVMQLMALLCLSELRDDGATEIACFAMSSPQKLRSAAP